MAQYLTYNNIQIASGDTVKIHQEITEGDKKRIQTFEGVVIAIQNRGLGQSFCVRKISTNSIGVEKIFPINTPSIKKIEVKRKGKVKKSKLYYLRDRVGKQATKTKEKKTFQSTKKAS